MRATMCWSLALLLMSATLSHAGGEKYTIKEGKKAPPKELDATIQKILSDQTVELYKDGKLAAEFWFCKVIPSAVPAAKAKKSLTYRDLKETTLLGAVKYHSMAKDYRQQKMMPGVYTMRLGFQPQDGDHMGTAPYTEFVVFVAAKFDPKADLLMPKAMVERSAAGIGTSHPAATLLFPSKADNKLKYKLVQMPKEHLVLQLRRDVGAAGNPQATIGISMTVVGHAAE